MNIINCTIVFQAIHFFIAYLLILWGFGPLYHAVRKRREELEYLRRYADGIQPSIEHAARVHKQRWSVFAREVKELLMAAAFLSKTDQVLPFSKKTCLSNVMYDFSEKTVAEMKNMLIQKILEDGV